MHRQGEPFAINVPAEVFKRHLATPAKLAEVLGNFKRVGKDCSIAGLIWPR